MRLCGCAWASGVSVAAGRGGRAVWWWCGGVVERQGFVRVGGGLMGGLIRKSGEEGGRRGCLVVV